MSACVHAFTVFTPTFNRANTLGRLFESLRRQTFRDFEWLVVDDGSTDGTPALFAGWRDAGFPIRYFRQENAGKHVAFNRGVREARGELFLNIDSDDELVPEALARFKHHWDAIPPEERVRFSAVTALCRDPRGKAVGGGLPAAFVDSDSLEMYFKLRVPGERCGFHRTAVLRDYPFPEPPGVRFVAESVVWFAIARRYKTRYVNEYLRVYHDDVAGPAGRLSQVTPSTAAGRRLFHQTVLNEYGDWLVSSPLVALKSVVNYARYSFAGGIGLGAQLRDVRSPACKLALLGLAPLGYGLNLRGRPAG